MVEPVIKMYSVVSDDEEIQALSVCIEVFTEIKDVAAKARVARYLNDRFPDCFELKQEMGT